jgi:fatty-acyl-CoA synthase
VVGNNGGVRVPDFTAKRAELDGDKVALVDPTHGHRRTYAQLEDRASRLAEFLRDDWGVGRGDRIATLARNRGDAVELLFACAKLDAVLVPLNWRLAEPELSGVVHDAEPLGLLFDRHHASIARRVVSASDTHVRTLSFDAGVESAPSYEDVLRHASGRQVTHAPREESTLWYLLYTSGTTGRPKGVKQTAGMAVVNHLNITPAAGLTADDVVLSVLPQFHSAGWNLYLLPMIMLGGTSVIPEGFDAEQSLRLLQDGVTAFFGVPTIYEMLADDPGFADADLRAVRSWASGGAAMPIPLLQRLDRRGIRVQQGMGMTETGPTAFLLDPQRAMAKAGSVGKPQPFIDVRLVGPDGRDVARGAAGEVLFKGPGVTPGYWRLPEETAAAFTDDGWLRSGDIARQDEDGYYYIVGRAKDMYVSGGENVYAAEVEEVLLRMEGVVGAAVVGMPHAAWGEVGMAYLEAAPGRALSEAEVKTFCRAHLAAYKVPASVTFIDALPRTATGKIRKHDLRGQPPRR